MPRREDSQSFIADVLRGVMVSVENRPTTRTTPCSLRACQGVVDRAARVAALRRRKEAVDGGEALAVPQRLVAQQPAKLSVGGVGERLTQLGSRQSLDVQVLNAHTVKPPDDSRTVLMKE